MRERNSSILLSIIFLLVVAAVIIRIFLGQTAMIAIAVNYSVPPRHITGSVVTNPNFDWLIIILFFFILGFFIYLQRKPIGNVIKRLGDKNTKTSRKQK